MQVILFTPAEIGADGLAERLDALAPLNATAAMIIVPSQADEDAAFRELKPLVPLIQKYDIAALVLDLFSLVPKLRADGAHITGGRRQFAEAREKLKPDLIVGAGDLRTRHEAMLRGEDGADYAMFGSPERAASAEELDIAQWWNETTEVDAALCIAPEQIADAKEAALPFIAFGPDHLRTRDAAESLIAAIAKLGGA